MSVPVHTRAGDSECSHTAAEGRGLQGHGLSRMSRSHTRGHSLSVFSLVRGHHPAAGMHVCCRWAASSPPGGVLSTAEVTAGCRGHLRKPGKGEGLSLCPGQTLPFSQPDSADRLRRGHVPGAALATERHHQTWPPTWGTAPRGHGQSASHAYGPQGGTGPARQGPPRRA